ncbi:MAG: hypothetical protein ABW019_06730 [Chitinophagaceae bacterium]
MPAPKSYGRSVALLLLFIIPCLQARAQSRAFEQAVLTSDSLNIRFPREKIFVHHDRPHYRPGDTLWLKGYILSGPEHMASDSSRLAYIELINAQHEVVKRISTPSYLGLFTASITLHEKHFPQGGYLLRAYTRYGQNFGDSLFFQSRFTIIDPRATTWQTAVHQLSFANNQLLVSARLTGANREPIANRAVSVRLRSKNNLLFRTRVLTDASGNFSIDTLLQDAGPGQLLLEIAGEDHLKMELPVQTGEQQPIDLQFLPEGGSFLAGRPQRLGFKALNASGKGIEVKGIIKDSKGAAITGFASIHKGMGIVSFTPRAGEAYTAVLDNGLSVPLPAPQASGMLLQVTGSPSADSIRLRIESSPDLYGRTAYFTACSQGLTAARGWFTLSPAGFSFSLGRNQLLPGISVITVYDEQLQPANARAVFTPHRDSLQLSLTPHKAVYGSKDSVSLRLQVRNSYGEAASGSFSVAVLDTSQVKLLADAENLVSYMLLSSDLRGAIEEPYYYFKHPDPGALEALLLTQGWVSYSRPAASIIPYEKDFVISGRVTGLFNKAVDGARVMLFGKAGKNDSFFADTLTGAGGTFAFRGFDFYETDSVSLLIKAVNRKGKAFTIDVAPDEPEYPPVNAATRLAGMGEMLADTRVRDYVARQEQVMEEMKKDGILLGEVVVNSRLRVPGSKNLNADGGADQVIGEDMLNKNPKESLLNILKSQVPGFRLSTPQGYYRLYYMIHSNFVRLVIDGVDVHFFFQGGSGQRDEYVQFLDSYLQYFTAADIRGIEIMNKPGHNSTYRRAFLSPEELRSTGPGTIDFSFIEITTRGGDGPLMKRTPGLAMLRPLYPVLARQFYSPRYTFPDQQTIVPDLRQTVYWHPDVATDANGEATVSFYTSESRSSGYLVIVQGTDLEGGLGVLYLPLVIAGDKTRVNK